MPQYFLGVDQGTTGVTAILFNEHWQQVAMGYREIQQIYPQDGWVEHDAEDILQSVCAAVFDAMTSVSATSSDILCVGLDHEGESVVVWDKATGKPIGNTIVWQDRRTADLANTFAATHGDWITERTGLRVDSYFSALKLHWLLKNIPEAQEMLAQGRLLAGTMDTWLVWNLSGKRAHITDVSTASRTMLMNISTQDWDDELLALFEIPRNILPSIHSSAAKFCDTDPAVFCGIKAPLCAVLADQQAALAGQGCSLQGMAKTTYGTGCFLLMNAGEKPIASKSGLIPTVAWRLNNKTTYALDGGVYIAGAATQWLRDGLKIIADAKETEQMAISAGSNGGVYFVPAFTGLADPYWDSFARGTVVGITGATTREHLVRATLEATAYQVCDLVRLMEADTQTPIHTMRCDGGAVGNRFLMQFQADILNIPLHVPTVHDTTALGVAFMAAVGAGYYQSPNDISLFWKISRCYEPCMSNDERESLLHNWHRAVQRSQNWKE